MSVSFQCWLGFQFTKNADWPLGPGVGGMSQSLVRRRLGSSLPFKKDSFIEGEGEAGARARVESLGFSEL
jgi:hypothetical protein